MSIKIKDQLKAAHDHMMDNPEGIEATMEEGRLFNALNKALDMEGSMKRQ